LISGATRRKKKTIKPSFIHRIKGFSTINEPTRTATSVWWTSW